MDDIRNYDPSNSSVLGRLLEELSWVGKTIKNYREGGRGYENVLTAEVFQSLDFLPRKQFFGEIIKNSHGADATRKILFDEIENIDFCLLPGNHYLIPSGTRHQTKLPVQPDGLIESENIYGVIEAKRIRSSSFQSEQLAREYVLALRDSNDKKPLLFLILGDKPPVKVTKHGKISIKDSIEIYIESVLERTERHSISKEVAMAQVDDVVCWITWEEIYNITKSQKDLFSIEDNSTRASITRLANSIIKSIEWHK